MASFLTPSIVPKLMASSLLEALESPDEFFFESFFAEFALILDFGVYNDMDLETEGILGRLTPAQSRVVLIMLR